MEIKQLYKDMSDLRRDPSNVKWKDHGSWMMRYTYYTLNPDLSETAKDDSDYRVRLLYFKLNPEMIHLAKDDNHASVRYMYYIFNKGDRSSINDTAYINWSLYLDSNPANAVIYKSSTNFMVRIIYYKLYPYDNGWVDDPHPLVRVEISRVRQ